MISDYTPPPKVHQVDKTLTLAPQQIEAMRPFITPETITLVREMMGWSPMAMATSAAIKKGKLNKFEDGTRTFSERDTTRISAMLVAAGIDIFSGQGETMISLPDDRVWSARELTSVFSAQEFLERRWDQGLSQNEIAAKANIPQAVVSGIETGEKQMGPFAVRLRHKIALQEALSEPAPLL